MARKTKVVLAIDGAFIGGGQAQLLAVAAGARDAGYDVHVFHSEEGPFVERLRASGYPLRRVPMGKRPSFTARKAWQDALRETAPDILHLHGGVAGFWGRWCRPAGGPKIVHTVHGIQFTRNTRPPRRWMYWALERWLAARADRTIFVCRSDAHRAEKLGIVRPERSRTVLNGVNLKNPPPPPVSRAALPVPPDAFIAGIVGRLEKVKGQRFAIMALPQVIRSCPTVHLVIFGEGTDQPELKDLARRLHVEGHVHFQGFIGDPRAAFQSLDVHVMPSLWEGLPLALLEGMQCGVPTVASEVDGIPEAVRHEQEALLVPPADPAAIAAAIERIFNDTALRRRLADAAKVRVVEFSEDAMVRATLAVYRELFDSKEENRHV